MALLIFPHDRLEPPIAYLLQPKLRRDVASMVNRAISDRQVRRREAALRDLVKMRQWAEKAARGSKHEIPDTLDLHLYGEDSDDMDSRPQEDGPDAMVTS